MSDDIKFPFHVEPESVLFDLGGYKGDVTAYWRQQYPSCRVFIWEPVNAFYTGIAARFWSDSLVVPINHAAGATDRTATIYVCDNATSLFTSRGEAEKVTVRSLHGFILENQIEHIGIMKVNIEGGEYEVLPALIGMGLISKIDNLVVQFHGRLSTSDDDLRSILNYEFSIGHQDEHWTWWKH